MDPLESLFAHVSPSARAFFAGNLCETRDFGGAGHLHLLRAGALRVATDGAGEIAVDRPAVIFFPRGTRHRFIVDPACGVDLACARVDLGGAQASPVAAALPEPMILPLDEHALLGPVCALLFDEAFGSRGARQAALDRLFDYLLIVLVRYAVDGGHVAGGVLAGLADPRLSRALGAMHAKPGRPWSLELLADEAGMSRTRFADEFRRVIGRTPMDYLTAWRMIAALRPLAQGRPVKSVAASVGYDSAAGFSRTFARVIGESPSDWIERWKASERLGLI